MLSLFIQNLIQKKNQFKLDQEEEIITAQILLKDVNYVSKDLKGNEYIIEAVQGEIDLEDTNKFF